MSEENEELLPLAPPGYEEFALDAFPRYRDLSPEEYAGKEAHGIACFSFTDYTYRNAEFNKWIHQLGAILFDSSRRSELREQYYSSDEIKRQDKDVSDWLTE